MSRVPGRLRRWAGRLWDALPGKPLVLEPLRRVRVLPEPVYRHLHFHGVFSTSVEGRRFRMRSHGGIIENELFWTGCFGGWEGASVRLWAALARDADVVLDVGANAGLYALVAAAISPRAHVVAFEPVPSVFARLEENARLNGGRIQCVRAAVTDRDGPVLLRVPHGDQPLAASVDPTVFGAETGRAWREVEVPPRDRRGPGAPPGGRPAGRMTSPAGRRYRRPASSPLRRPLAPRGLP